MNENFVYADNVIKSRRLKAENTLEKRRLDVYKKVPEIMELERHIATTNAELIKHVIGKKSKQNFENIKNRNLQAQQMIDELLSKNGYKKDWLTAPYTCKKCDDTGFFDNGRCSCFTLVLKKYAVDKLNASANMPDNDFEHFSLSFYKGEAYNAMSQILDYCKEYADDFSLESDNLLFYGNTGIGKTHLSLSIAKVAAQNGFNAVYGSLQNFLYKIEREHFGKAGNTDYETDTMQTLIDTDLLVLDDLGSEFFTSFTESQVYNIINSRINLCRPTIVSTNFSKEELQKKYNDRIVSRIIGSYQPVLFYGEDVRQQKRRLSVDN